MLKDPPTLHACFYLLLAIFSPALVRLFVALPNAVVTTITGLALIPGARRAARRLESCDLNLEALP